MSVTAFCMFCLWWFSHQVQKIMLMIVWWWMRIITLTHEEAAKVNSLWIRQRKILTPGRLGAARCKRVSYTYPYVISLRFRNHNRWHGWLIIIITMTSWWVRWRLKSSATQPFIQAQIKENIKAPRHWPLCGEFTGDQWIPRTNGQ